MHSRFANYLIEEIYRRLGMAGFTSKPLGPFTDEPLQRQCFPRRRIGLLLLTSKPPSPSRGAQAD